MTTVYIPYEQDRPAAVEINGHRLLILVPSREELEQVLGTCGADEGRQVELGGDETDAREELATAVEGGGVGEPTVVTGPDMVQSLRSELPWVH